MEYFQNLFLLKGRICVKLCVIDCRHKQSGFVGFQVLVPKVATSSAYKLAKPYQSIVKITCSARDLLS